MDQANVIVADAATATSPSEMSQGKKQEEIGESEPTQATAPPLPCADLDHLHRTDTQEQNPLCTHVQDEPLIQGASNVDCADGSKRTATVGRGFNETASLELEPELIRARPMSPHATSTTQATTAPSDTKRSAPESRVRPCTANNCSPLCLGSQRRQASDTGTDPVCCGDSATPQQQAEARQGLNSNQALGSAFFPFFPYQLQQPPSSNPAHQLDPTQLILQQNSYFQMQLMMLQSQSLLIRPSLFSGPAATGAPVPNTVDGGDGSSVLPFSLPGTGATDMPSMPTATAGSASSAATAAAASPATTNMAAKRGHEEMMQGDEEEKESDDDDDEIERIYCTKPKRPKSAYNYFFKDERVKLLEEIQEAKGSQDLGTSDRRLGRKKKHRTKISFEDMAKTIAKRWKEIDPTRLSEYKSLARKDKQRYEEELELYREIQENTKDS